MVSTQTLVRVAMFGGVATLGAGIFFKTRIEKNFTKQGFFVGSLHILEGYKDGGDILGRPVRIRRVDMGDRENNWTDGLNARVAIPVSGSNEKGILHTWASRPDLQQSWNIDKADLEVNGKRWTFFIHPNARGHHSATHQTDSNNIT